MSTQGPNADDIEFEYGSKVKLILVAAILFTLTTSIITSQKGLIDPFEAEVLITTLKTLENTINPVKNAGSLLWPGSLTGPLTYYLQALNLMIFSFILRIPMDAASRIPSIISMPLIIIATFNALKNTFGRVHASLATSLMIVLPITVHASHSTFPAATTLLAMMCAINFAGAYARTGDWIHALLSGIFTGISLIIDLSSVIVLVPATYILTKGFTKVRRVDDLSAFMIPIILCAIPLAAYTMMNINNIISMATVDIRGVESFNGSQITYNRHYFIETLLPGLGAPVLLAAIGGLLASFARPGTMSNMNILYTLLAICELSALSMLGLMRPYHIIIIVIPAIMLIAHLIKTISQSKPNQSLIITATLLIATLYISVTNQVTDEKNMPLTGETQYGVHYIVNGESVHKRASRHLLAKSSPQDEMIASTTAYYYMLMHRPVKRFDEQQEQKARFIALNGIDYHRFKSRKNNKNLKAIYRMAQKDGILSIIYEAPGHYKQEESGETEELDKTLNKAVYNYLESKATNTR
ncbi:ArnT family glycosyltransferase [Candidatus Altiarchaeota archaeon]